MTLKTIAVVLTADSSSLRTQLIAAARQVEGFEKSVDGAGNSVSRSSELMAKAAKGGVLVLGAALALSVKGAMDFETAMRNVNSISGLSEAAFRAQGAAVLDLSRHLPQSAKTLAEGLYDIASSGFQGAEGLEVLEQSAKAASAGLTTTANSAKAITAVLNAYGLTADDAADVSDTLFQTVNLGVISFEQLTGVIGDTVGTAAAAGVGIDEVGAAIATMTLAGISGAEAGTSLNRVLQSIIDPGDDLAFTLHALGYESGSSALKADGLRGVMMKLQEATGGNIDALLALFPEIRAARGALALLSAEGENYNRVADQIEDKNARAGATQKALNEQMKATSAQVKVFLNDLNALAIQGGTLVLPFINDMLRGARELGADALPGLRAGFAALQPFFRNLAEVGGDAADIVGELVDALGPLAAALLGLAAGGVITSLNGLSDVLSAITGFLAGHETAVASAAVAWAAFTAATKAAILLESVPKILDALSVGAAKAALGVGNLAASLTTLKGAAGALGVVAAVLTLTGIVENFTSASAAAKHLRDEMSSKFDTSSLEGMREALRQLGDETRKLDDKTDVSLWTATWKTAADFLPIVDTGFTKTWKSSRALSDEWKSLAVRADNLRRNLDEVAGGTGQTRDSVESLAKSLGVDLTQSFDQSAPARAKLIAHFNDLAKAAYGGGEALKNAGKLDLDKLEADASAVADLVKKVGDSFAKATDIVGGFTADVAKNTGLKQFLTDNLREAETFSTRITEAMRKGLDPGIIKRLLEAGPAAAAPFLDAIANDHSGNLVEMANKTERALQEINSKIVAFARLTQQAINDSASDQKVRDLGRAMEITAAQFDSAGTITKQAIADKIGVPLAEVDRIAKEFGITVGATAEPITVAGKATDGFSTALGGLRSALQQNGPYVGEYTEGGKRNKEAIDGVIASIKTHMETLDRQGATMDEKRGAFNRHVEDLRTVLAQAGLTKSEIDALVGSLKGYEGTYKASVELNTSAANASLDQLKGRLAELDLEIAQSGPGGGRGAERNAVQSRIDEGGGGSSEPAPQSRLTEDQHEGGVLRFYAAGGMENHVAQIAPAGANRVWAEPETGGEAYIPLAPSKRGRSIEVLRAVAQEFGLELTRKLADGGMVSFAGGGVSQAWSPPGLTTAYTDARRLDGAGGAGAGLDCDRLIRGIGDRLESVLRNLPQPVIEVDRKRFGQVAADAIAGHRQGRL